MKGGPGPGGVERFGPYELVSLVGRGGMGEVYRAYDTSRRRTVALKRLPRHLAGDPDYEVRFRREAEVAARLTEPHIIPIHDYGEIDGQLYIDMRLITGTDLADVIRDSGPLPPARAVAVIGQVATALAAAHAEGLVHRDVKPSNVLLSPTDRGEDFVHLVDFGIVHERNSTALTADGSTIGTIDYMAPERLLQAECDHRVDVYSLGCVLYEALTGSKPFPTGSAAATMFAHMNTPPPRPSQQRPGIPPALDEVVARAMAKEPSQRYSTTTDLAKEAYRALSGAPAPSPGGGPTSAATRIGPGITGVTGYGTAGPAPTGYGTVAGPAPTRVTPPPTRGAPAAPPATARMAPGGPPGERPPDREPPPRAPRRVLPFIVLAAVVLVAVAVGAILYTRSSGTAASGSLAASSTAQAGLPTTVDGAGAGGQAAPAPAAAGALTVVTGTDGSVAEVKTSSLQLCGGDEFALASGQQVAVATISRVDVLSVGTTESSVGITLTDGQSVDGKIDIGCAVTGLTSIGTFNLELSRVTTVEINR